MTKHLKIGGSTASRTINCPGWLSLVDKVPTPPSNDYADEGNLLHDCMEMYYMEGIEFSDMIGKMYEKQVLAKHHLPILDIARTATERVMNKYDIDDYICEPFVQYEVDKIGGSIDMLAVSKDRETVLLSDYKFGVHKVLAENNKQLSFYGLCASVDPLTADMFSHCKTLVFSIVQPKVNPFAQVWTASLSLIYEFEEQLNKALANPNTFKTGKHCDFCPCIPLCPEKQIKVPDFLIKNVVNYNINK